MTQDRTISQCQHRGHPSALIAWSGMADGVDPAVKTVEATGLVTFRCSRTGQPSLAQLLVGDRAVLAAGDLGNRSVWGRFCQAYPD